MQVFERVVEVEADKAALVEQLRAQMKVEMEAQQQQQLEGQALEAARQEAEARARQQLEVGTWAHVGHVSACVQWSWHPLGHDTHHLLRTESCSTTWCVCELWLANMHRLNMQRYKSCNIPHGTAAA